MIEQRQKISNFCAQMVDYRRPGHKFCGKGNGVNVKDLSYTIIGSGKGG